MASPSPSLVKFPRTPHILNPGGSAVSDDDLLLSDSDLKPFLKPTIVTVEEKVDGANLGIHFDGYTLKTQNRSHWIDEGTHKQFGNLANWCSEHRTVLWELLGDKPLILYGEWLRARHSIPYDKLPDWFLVVDIYNRDTGKFCSVEQRDKLIIEANGVAEAEGEPVLKVVRPIARRTFASKEEYLQLLESARSEYYDGPVEGLYCRVDDGQYLALRGKLVRPDFTNGIDIHWTKKDFTKNSLTAHAN